jgi:glycosyltransferase involved in cell wall biosynthesis
MAAAVPSLVSPGVALAREIEVAGMGWVVARESLAAGLAAILADRTACESRGRLARQHAEQYRWPRVGHALAEVYQRVADRRFVQAAITAGASGTGLQAGVPR